MTALKQIPAPDLTAVLEETKADLRYNFNSSNIGIIESFDASDQTASIRIAIKQVQNVAPDGTRFFVEYPLLKKCPVMFPSGGGFTLTFPVNAGDECIVLFNDRELDNWFLNGGVQAPVSARSHDISDAIAIVGIRSNPRKLSGVSTTATQLRADDGTSFVEANAQGIRVHSGTVYQWDVHGYGQRITWLGGVNYRIDNYVLGATVSTIDHLIQQPGPPV